MYLSVKRVLCASVLYVCVCGTPSHGWEQDNEVLSLCMHGVHCVCVWGGGGIKREAGIHCQVKKKKVN